MSEISEELRRKLLKNENVSRVKDKHVEFVPEFKIWAVKEYKKGKSPADIFSESGFDSAWFPKDYFRSCLKRWKKKFDEVGASALKVNNTGKGSSGRPKKNCDDLTLEELRVLVEIQRETIEMLKKNRALPKKKES